MTRGAARFWRETAAVAALLLLALAPAAQAKVFGPQGDVARGRTLSAACARCHGPHGRATEAGIPHLAGQNYGYLIEQLRHMRWAARQRAGMALPHEQEKQQRNKKFSQLVQRRRDNPVMDSVLLDLDDADIRDLAAYYATRACESTPVAVAPQRPMVVTRCVVCHGDGGISDNEMIPTLAGQDVAYLENEIKVLRAAGQAVGPNGEARQGGMMSRQAATLDDQQISALAVYFSALPCSRP